MFLNHGKYRGKNRKIHICVTSYFNQIDSYVDQELLRWKVNFTLFVKVLTIRKATGNYGEQHKDGKMFSYSCHSQPLGGRLGIIAQVTSWAKYIKACWAIHFATLQVRSSTSCPDLICCFLVFIVSIYQRRLMNNLSFLVAQYFLSKQGWLIVEQMAT